ncbi:MAG: phenylalanine--tRNA ligase subunit alpha [Dehalococcoidia bacterium]|nr:MAG: phenylalanine--tRNA ligase subunit alpha [Dehalococcoidia bacterium]
MISELEELIANALRELEAVTQDKDLEAWRVRYLGKKSQLTTILRGLTGLPMEERKRVGALANRIRAELENSYQQKIQLLREDQLVSAVGAESLDITLPGRLLPGGRLHPITQTIQEIHEIFVSMGFQVMEAPEVEWDYYNFEALNIPHHHPARDSMATLWVDYKNEKGERDMLLRTHNTAGDIRAMEMMKPPIRVVTTGKVYRYEASDATHLPMFYQIDGFAVDKSITMAELKGTLYEFARRFFGEERKVRFRCDYFPFVEPGVEMAIECGVCGGKGCRLCGDSGWIEILGAGMTHPKVLERGGLDPKVYSSFAFGMGIDRLPMLRYGIDDIRLFYGSDLRFLRQF